MSRIAATWPTLHQICLLYNFFSLLFIFFSFLEKNGANFETDETLRVEGMPKLVQGNLCDKIVFLSLFLLLNRVLAWTFTEGRWNFNQKQNPKQNQINFYPPFPLFLCLQRKSQRKHSFTIIKKKMPKKTAQMFGKSKKKMIIINNLK